MAAHRYWRLFISGKGSGLYVAITELVLAVAASGPQAAVGGIASGTGDQVSGTPSKAFDGIVSPENYWLSNYFNGTACAEYLQYEMPEGSPIDVAEIRITSSALNSPNHYPANFSLYYSDDGASWEIQKSWSGQVFTSNETKTFDATPLLSSEIVNRLVMLKTLRRNDQANVGPSNSGRSLQLPILMANASATTPAMTSSYTGRYYIAGSTTVLGKPEARRVNLIDQRSGLLVKSLVTGEDGQFLFSQIGAGPWTVLGVDLSAEQNSVVYAHVTPEPMT